MSLGLTAATLGEHCSQVMQTSDIHPLGHALTLGEPYPRFLPYPNKFKEYRTEADV